MYGSGREGSPIVISTGINESGEIEVSVSDQGIGIDTAIASDVFMPFKTTKASGMGIGLSISDSIISAHGGQIRYRANKDSPGTTFVFTLPEAPSRGAS